MKDGNWVPISKGFLFYLPKDRTWTKIEAALSLQADYDHKKPVTIAGYSALWRWSRKKVRVFLNKMGVEIIYPENTQKKQNQRGQIRVQIRDRSDEKKEQIRLIDSKGLEAKRDRPKKKKEQKRDRSGATTRILDPNNNISSQKKANNPCPHDQIIDVYHEILPELPKVRTWTNRRRSFLEARWNERYESRNGFKSNTLEFWEALFRYIHESDFLMGRKTDFRVNLEWIITKRNFYKIIEGNYHN